MDSFLDPAEAVTCTASYSITQADLNAGSVTNTAKASADGIDSNEDKATVTAVQSPSLLLDKTASPLSADAVGDVISYTYLVRNNGNVRLAGPVTVADDKATVSCPALSTIGNHDGFLDPGESITLHAPATRSPRPTSTTARSPTPPRQARARSTRTRTRRPSR